MTPELKAKWLADLRTPGRKQAKEVLCNGHGAHCCLGRLALVAGKRVWSEDRERDSDQWRSDNELSDAGLEEFGLTSDQACQLMRMNDGGSPDYQRRTFGEIADWIAENI